MTYITIGNGVTVISNSLHPSSINIGNAGRKHTFVEELGISFRDQNANNIIPNNKPIHQERQIIILI